MFYFLKNSCLCCLKLLPYAFVIELFHETKFGQLKILKEKEHERSKLCIFLIVNGI